MPFDAAPTLSAKNADKGGGTPTPEMMYHLRPKGQATRLLHQVKPAEHFLVAWIAVHKIEFG